MMVRMPTDLDPYAVLGVTPTATPVEIAHAFRAKLRTLHPDTRHTGASTAGAEIQLQQVLAAYHLLRSEPQRSGDDLVGSPSAATPKHQPPLTIPITYRRTLSATHPEERPLWAGPVHWRR